MQPTGLRILLVSTSRDWIKAVHAASDAVGADALDFVASGREAMARIVTSALPYSHLLVQPSGSEGLLPTLHGLASGEVGSDTALLLLGAPKRPVAQVPVISRPSKRSIIEALGPHEGARRASRPTGAETLDLVDALAHSMIEARYQPVVRIADGACICLEALARLNHPTRGMFSPIDFVPRAEEAGLAGELTAAVASHAWAELAGPLLSHRDLTIALNLPLALVIAPDAMVRLGAQRDAAGIRPEQIVIELTESRPVSDLRGLQRSVMRLRREGYGVAIDDLGPAVPHYAALLEMPFTAVKLDIDVIRNMREKAGSAFLFAAIAAAKANGLTIVAEGVEDRQTWDRLADLGVDEVQGFLVSRPLPAAALPVWLDAWPSRRVAADRPQLTGLS